VFSQAAGGLYDIMVCMYHDQGHIPTKVQGFVYDRKNKRWNAVAGVNITLGLPIVRTSVDHGTAFDHAGKGDANALSLVNAIEYGAHLARPYL
jgi:4-hydroxythreonine-4-phosphate dehydrogenase